MTKNPDRRLGSLNDADEVMEQSFFAVIDWADLQKKRIIPPFKPVVSKRSPPKNFTFNFPATITSSKVKFFSDTF